MALDKNTLADRLKGIYREMREAAAKEPKNDDWFAEQFADAVTEYILTADVNAGIDVSGGTQTGGSLVGAKTSAKGSLS